MDDDASLMTTEVVLGRMRDYGLIGAAQTASLIMGGVFAGAAVTFTEILRVGDALPVRLSAWAYGVTASVMSLDGFIRRGLLEGRPILRAVPVVGLGGVLSMVGFALLGPQTGGPDGWRYSQLVLLLVGLLFSQSWGGRFADHVEPALRPIYEGHMARSRRREKQFWPLTLAAALPWGLAMVDKYGGVPLQYPITAVNVALCGLYGFSLVQSQRYYAALCETIHGAHEAKLRDRRAEAPPGPRRTRKRAVAPSP